MSVDLTSMIKSLSFLSDQNKNVQEIQFAGGVTKFLSENEIFQLKNKYAEALLIFTNSNSLRADGYAYDNLKELLLKLDVTELQSVYLALRDTFTPKIENSTREEIIKELLTVSQDQWPKIMKQVNFIMPFNTMGHDVCWATAILCAIQDPSYRELLVDTAARFFKSDTLTIERGYILKALSKLTAEGLSQHAEFNEEQRATFIQENVPASLKEGARIAHRFDPILNEGWKV